MSTEHINYSAMPYAVLQRLIVLILVVTVVPVSTMIRAAEPEILSVLNPTGYPPAIERTPLAPRPASLDGRTVYLVDITFNNGDLLLQRMQDWMARHMPEVDTDFRIKRGIYIADDPELWREIQAGNGVMVMAIGH